MEADEAVVQYLSGAGLGLVVPPTAGANLFRGPVRPPGNGVPVEAVFCLLLEGRTPNPLQGQSFSAWVYEVQVRVRAAAVDFGGGQAAAAAVLRALQKATLPGDFAYCLAQRSSPTYMGLDAQQLPEWTIPLSVGTLA